MCSTTEIGKHAVNAQLVKLAVLVVRIELVVKQQKLVLVAPSVRMYADSLAMRHCQQV